MRHLTPASPSHRLVTVLCVGLTSLVIPHVSVAQSFTSDVSVTTPSSPLVQFSQDGGPMPTAPNQSWAVGGNHDGFFVRDVTDFNIVPFIIRKGTPNSGGNVGIGTGSAVQASQKLHVYQDVNANSFILNQNPNAGTTSAAVIRTQSNVATLNFQAHAAARTVSRFGQTLGGWNEMLAVTGNGFAIGTFADVPLVLGANSLMRVRVTSAGVEVFGTLTNSSSREYKEAIRSLGATEAAEALAGLQPVKFRYKDQAKENLGFIAEDVPALVAMEGRKSIAPMDLIALLTKVVQEQQKTIDDQRAAIDAQRDSIEVLRQEQWQALAALGAKVAHLEDR
jgi:Chaperone of endosialidase